MKICDIEEAIKVIEESTLPDEKIFITSISKVNNVIKICIANDGWYHIQKGKLRKASGTTIYWGVCVRDLERMVDAFLRKEEANTYLTLFNCSPKSQPYFGCGTTYWIWNETTDEIEKE